MHAGDAIHRMCYKLVRTKFVCIILELLMDIVIFPLKYFRVYIIMAELQSAPSIRFACQQQFQELITDALCSIEILFDNVEAKTVKLTAASSKQVASDNTNWGSTIAEALQEGARKAIMGKKVCNTSRNLEEEASDLSQALIESDPIVALLESILVGVQSTEPSVLDATSEEATVLSNVTKAINALEDFCKAMSPGDMKDVLQQAVNLPHILQMFYSFASELFFCKLLACVVESVCGLQLCRDFVGCTIIIELVQYC